VRIVACINDKTVIDKILDHADKRDKDLKELFNTFSIRGPPESARGLCFISYSIYNVHAGAELIQKLGKDRLYNIFSSNFY
jgi:hypothetical protein